ncbi:MAG: ATP-dependent helicase HrpB [Ignavibacteriae bacterium]|nr:ATP-dependent helicase HrpB [Ignavibacteriota bacterium]
MTKLPVDEILPELMHAFSVSTAVVFSSDPGAGKTTRVPVALLEADWLAGKKVMMLEPRRLAAQRAAQFMAAQLGEPVGKTVGYRIRGDARVSPDTRIEIVTEGILTRLMQDSPDLPDVGVVMFDEFHERSIHADLGLAFTLDVQRNLRADLRLLVMSATLDGLAISRLLGDAPLVQSSGRMFPVETHYLARTHERGIESAVVSSVLSALNYHDGDLLVFLPGQREIRKVESLLRDAKLPAAVAVHTLFGDLPPGKQQAALRPVRPGQRKVILSTSIAETSVTIEGVRVVIDSGLSRMSRFDPRRGMSGLITTPVSQASADQRRGRAGREAAGVCYRLWTVEQHSTLPRFSAPEIVSADLAPLALDLACWGTPNGEGLRFIDPPPAAHLRQAQSLLRDLGALSDAGTLMPHGRAMSRPPVHPRLAHMLIKGKELGLGSLACDVAAVLDERDLLRGERDADIDLESRLHALRNGGVADSSARRRALDQAKRLRSVLDVKQAASADNRAGVLLALAYPERIGQRRGERYQLSGGPHAVMPQRSLLVREKYIAIGEVDGVGSEVKVFLAAPLDEADLRSVFEDRLHHDEEVRWDAREEAVKARRVTRLGAIELAESRLTADADAVSAAMLEGVRSLGLECLPWTTDATAFANRSEWLRRKQFVDDEWPALDYEHLLATLDHWLGPFLRGMTKRSQLAGLNLAQILRSLFTYHQLSLLDRLAPTHLVAPTGSKIPVDYSGEQPVLAVRMQEMFGEASSPRVADGRVAVLLHLLSPARRPLAVTQDLASFWANAYADVRKEMRGRYPKHYWPENPLEAAPTKRTKTRM